jgi:hypothetical protein
MCHIVRLLKISCAILLLFLLGCTQKDDAQERMKTYVERVAYVLDEDFTWELKSPPALPPQRDRLLTPETITEGLLDVLDFRHCDLLPLIAKRNSSLGKLATPSAAMIYEIQFIQQLHQCLPLIESQSDITSDQKQHFKSIYANKIKSLPIFLWNAIYTGQEIETSQALNQPPLPLSIGDHDTTLRNIESLAAFITSAATTPEAFNSPLLSNIEPTYESIFKDPLGTPLLKSLLLLEATLNETAAVIENRLKRRPMCFNEMSNPKADILKTVFMQHYAAQVQPYMAAVHKIGDRWLSAHEKMLSNLPAPVAMNLYIAQALSQSSDMSIWKRYLTARDRHTAAWKSILEQCNLLPKAPNQS